MVTKPIDSMLNIIIKKLKYDEDYYLGIKSEKDKILKILKENESDMNIFINLIKILQSPNKVNIDINCIDQLTISEDKKNMLKSLVEKINSDELTFNDLILATNAIDIYLTVKLYNTIDIKNIKNENNKIKTHDFIKFIYVRII